MISDILEYDSIRESKKKKNLILSYDNAFKEKYSSINSDDINIGFKEDSFEKIDADSMRKYFHFFMKVLPELNYVCIDCNDYSLGFSMIQSAALDVPSIKEIKLYADDTNNQMDFHILKNSNIREKTYSRRKFLNS